MAIKGGDIITLTKHSLEVALEVRFSAREKSIAQKLENIFESELRKM